MFNVDWQMNCFIITITNRTFHNNIWYKTSTDCEDEIQHIVRISRSTALYYDHYYQWDITGSPARLSVLMASAVVVLKHES